jgi:hypothetical protein
MYSADKNISRIDPSTAVLFLGSGFSLESTNILGKAPPNGAALRRHFIDELELPADTTYDIQVLADEFAEQNPDRLFRELHNIFRIHEAGVNQRRILSEQWYRIYTTNYDDVVEYCHRERNLKPISFDLSEAIPDKLPHNSVIHLHGSMRHVNSRQYFV